MNKQKNKLTKAISFFTILFLGLITVSTTANAFFIDWWFGDSLTTIMVIVICVVVLAVIGFIIYVKFFTPAGAMSNLKK
jgi:hypothetical protein